MSIQRLSNAGQSGYRYKTLIAGITPVASVPVIGDATALTYSTASVAFTAPGAYAGSTYTATSSPGGLTGTSASSPITVSGLSENTAYTFTVTATNASGTSSPSAASNSITTPVAWAPAGAFDSLASVTLSSITTTVTFAGIPDNYKHLQARIFAQGNRATYAFDSMSVNVNGDYNSNMYSYHALLGNGNGSSATAQQAPNNTQTNINYSIGGSPYGNYGVAIMDLLDYSSSTKYKTFRSIAGTDSNGEVGGYGGLTGIYSGGYFSLNPVTSITFYNADGFSQHSSFALYGVK